MILKRSARNIIDSLRLPAEKISRGRCAAAVLLLWGWFGWRALCEALREGFRSKFKMYTSVA